METVYLMPAMLNNLIIKVIILQTDKPILPLLSNLN